MLAHSKGKYFNMMNDDMLSFIYSGKIDDELITACVGIIEEDLRHDVNLKKQRRKLSFLIIEILQNILRYGNTHKYHDFDYCKETFVVRNTLSGLYIYSVNLIKNDKIKFVKDRITKINSLDSSALNKFYRETLTNETFTEAGGAGLGFIEMVRKTKQKIAFDFVKINEQYSYIYISLKSVEHVEPQNINKSKVDLIWFENFHKEKSLAGVMIMHKGMLYPKIIEHSLSLVGDNVKSKKFDSQQVVFNLILESLQNIHLNSLENFNNTYYCYTLKKSEKQLILSTFKYICTNRVEKLKKLLSEIKQLSQKKLVERHNKVYSLCSTDADIILELVLMELAIETGNTFEYEFAELPNSDKTPQLFHVKF